MGLSDGPRDGEPEAAAAGVAAAGVIEADEAAEDRLTIAGVEDASVIVDGENGRSACVARALVHSARPVPVRCRLAASGILHPRRDAHGTRRVTQRVVDEVAHDLREALAVSDDAYGREVGAYHDRLAVTGRGSAAGAQHLGVGDVVEIDVSKGERKGVVVGAREGEQRLDDALQPQRLGVDDARRFGRFGVCLLYTSPSPRD